MVIDLLEKKIKTLESMNEYRMECYNRDVQIIIDLKQSISDCLEKGIQ